jgi:uncharacterized protein YcfL
MRLILLSNLFLFLVACSTSNQMAKQTEEKSVLFQKNLPNYTISDLECLDPDVRKRVIERDLKLELRLSDFR